jgi:hypothetical protein
MPAQQAAQTGQWPVRYDDANHRAVRPKPSTSTPMRSAGLQRCPAGPSALAKSSTWPATGIRSPLTSLCIDALRELDRGHGLREAERSAPGPTHTSRPHPGSQRRELPPARSQKPTQTASVLHRQGSLNTMRLDTRPMAGYACSRCLTFRPPPTALFHRRLHISWSVFRRRLSNPELQRARAYPHAPPVPLRERHVTAAQLRGLWCPRPQRGTTLPEPGRWMRPHSRDWCGRCPGPSGHPARP